MKGLYIVTPDWDDTQKLLEVTEMALKGGAVLVQYRHKFADEKLRRDQAQRLLDLCRAYQRQLVINDYIDLCLAIGADGVHVGGTDTAVAEVRKAVGSDKIVGASCYGDLQLARAAAQDGASYVAFGGFYPSRVKKYPVTTQPEIISQAKAELAVPVVVIGGMTVENSTPLVAAGADMVAAISSVYQAAGPQTAASQFAALFAA